MYDSDQVYPADLIWQCRRGMLELDLLLQPFVESQWQRLTAKEQADLRALLKESDPALYLWLTGQSTAPKEFLHIVQRIRQANHSASLGLALL